VGIHKKKKYMSAEGKGKTGDKKKKQAVLERVMTRADPVKELRRSGGKNASVESKGAPLSGGR